MTQGDCLEILSKKKRWMTTKEITKRTRTGVRSTNVNLNKLHQEGLIEHKKEYVSGWRNFWKIKDKKKTK